MHSTVLIWCLMQKKAQRRRATSRDANRTSETSRTSRITSGKLARSMYVSVLCPLLSFDVCTKLNLNSFNSFS